MNPGRTAVVSPGSFRDKVEVPRRSEETFSSILRKIDAALEDMAEEKRKTRLLHLQLGIGR